MPLRQVIASLLCGAFVSCTFNKSDELPIASGLGDDGRSEPDAEESESSGGDATTEGTEGEPKTIEEGSLSEETDEGGGAGSDEEDEESEIRFDTPSENGTKEEDARWLIHVDQDGIMTHIDVDTAKVSQLCQIIDKETHVPRTAAFSSLTFTRDDRLFASSGTTLWEIFLPACELEEIGTYTEGYHQINGISPDESGNGLLGISAQANALVRIDRATAEVTLVGALGQDWGTHGGTWNDDEMTMFGVEGKTDALYEIDTMSGMASVLHELSINFTVVGIEYHPTTRMIYTCTGDEQLYVIGESGQLETVGTTGLERCSNLGAPWRNPELPPID